MNPYDLVRVAAVVPRVCLADVSGNVDAIRSTLAECKADAVDVAVYPELALTGYTCNELFFQRALRDATLAGLTRIAEACDGIAAIVGLPLLVDDQMFNVAAFLAHGRVLGFVPKTYLPNYKEFYDARYFAPAAQAYSHSIGDIPFGTDLLFPALNKPGLCIGIEICEDLWVPVPPSSVQATHGATLLVNASASNETIGKAAYRRQLVANQSARCIAAYAYASSGVGESTTDLVFGGHALIAENGSMLAESTRFERTSVITTVDIDIERLTFNRMQTTSFGDGPQVPFRRIGWSVGSTPADRPLRRRVDAHPFVPAGTHELDARCDEIFHIQTAGLAGRLERANVRTMAIGISGGLDSTLALLVLCRTLDLLGIGREKIRALTLPGFGTTGRTLANAVGLMDALGVSYRKIDIRPMCFAEMIALGHRPFGIALDDLDVETLSSKLRDVPTDNRHDLTFENIQARMRTSLLMNTGFVIGTGDLSELALGWCTYNADHMSMYNPNVSIPKTLVKFLVRWAAENVFEGETRRILADIVATEISPELLPPGPGGEVQSTEGTIGPYELHDFFLYHFLRFGMAPSKILYLARHAKFDRDYSESQLRQWLTTFLKRFFASQFKRSCIPDGPKVGSVSLSPRGDWRMPSDAQVRTWLEELAILKEPRTE